MLSYFDWDDNHQFISRYPLLERHPVLFPLTIKTILRKVSMKRKRKKTGLSTRYQLKASLKGKLGISFDFLQYFVKRQIVNPILPVIITHILRLAMFGVNRQNKRNLL